MRALCIFVLILVLTAVGCTITEDGQLDLVVDTTTTKSIIQAAISIGLPLVLDQMDKDDLTQHTSTISSAISAILVILENDTQQLDTEAVNSLLSSLNDKLSTSECYAIQSSIELVLSLITSSTDSALDGCISQDVRDVLIFFFKEVKSVYELYNKASKPVLKAKLRLRKQK